MSDHNRDVIAEFRANAGKVGGPFEGRPMLLLTTTGARSGQSRTSPLVYTTDADRLVVIASKGGAPTNPDWYHNLVAHPHVELQDGPVKRDYTAREVHGEERAIWWERAVAAWPDYANYQTKTSRQIPVFVLSPRDA